MLKIKDNVDLKELEKFGFKKDEHGYYTEDTYISINPKDGWTSNKEICEKSFESTPTYADTLYDLIKADLVEKVDD